MKMVKFLSLVALMVLTFAACQKEVSFESGGTVSGGGVTLGANCRVQQIVSIDTFVNAGYYSVAAIFNANNLAGRLEFFDSVAVNLDESYDVTYTGDTARINADQYFVLDANKRVTTYYTLEDPTDPTSQELKVVYNYNAGGQLVSKDINVIGGPIPIVLARVIYTYTGNNLTKMEATSPLFNVKVQDADIEYYTDKRPKNFLYFFPDAVESEFLLGLNLGNRTENAPKKMVIRNYDILTGMPQDSAVGNFSNYEFSRDGYALSFFLDSDLRDIYLFAGKNKLNYKCQ
jgi:hypothetical protein